MRRASRRAWWDGGCSSPLDLEEIFSLTGGGIFHGALSLDQLLDGR
jgi:phytoene dehydrogenase-like protein